MDSNPSKLHLTGVGLRGFLRRLGFQMMAWLKTNATAISIFASALIVRLYHITYPIYDCMSFRQTQTASTILNYYRDGIDLLLPKVNSLGSPGVLVLEFPLFQGLSALIYKLSSPDIIYIRFLSIICCLVAAVYLYKIARLFFDKTSAIFSIIFFLFAPLNIFFSRTPMIETFAAMLSIMFLYYFVQWITLKKTYMLVLGIMLASLALVVKPPYSLIMFPVIVYYAFYIYRLKTFKDKQLWIGVFIPMIILVIWQMYANHANAMYNSINDYPYKQLHGAFEVKLSELNTWYFGTMAQRLDPWTYLTIGYRVCNEVLTVIGTVLVLVSIPLTNKKHGLFFEVWLATVILSFVVLLNLNYVHNYYQLPCVSILAIYCGRGLKIVWDKIKSIDILKYNKYKIIVTVLLLYLANVAYVINNVNYFHTDTPGYYELGVQINKTLPNNDDMVAISTDSNDLWNPTLLYFADKKGYMLPQSMLNEEMVSYCRDKGVTWLIIINYNEYSKKYDTNYLKQYSLSTGTDLGMVIYRIDGQGAETSGSTSG
jgi:hypothetical protein